ncbi:MAG: hypothetical protein JEY97_03510 [Bacteroidales bacterium]|nr:hypothetical protein [Bacteroidales bacterium]
MPRLSIEVKNQIKGLSRNELEQIVLKIAAKEQSAFDFIMVNYLEKELGEKDLFEKTKLDIDVLFSKRYKGFSEELRLANMLDACIKRINEFTNVSKNKVMEADLLIYILDVPFSLSADFFGTCFTKYDSRVGIIVKRLITLVTKKLHPDYLNDYKQAINDYLKILHQTSNHIDAIYNLPNAI